MRNLILIPFIVILLFGCATWQEMGETGEVPKAAQNRVKAGLQAYCEAPILSNIERIVVRALRIFDPEWQPTCDAYFAAKAAE